MLYHSFTQYPNPSTSISTHSFTNLLTHPPTQSLCCLPFPFLLTYLFTDLFTYLLTSIIEIMTVSGYIYSGGGMLLILLQRSHVRHRLNGFNSQEKHRRTTNKPAKLPSWPTIASQRLQLERRFAGFISLAQLDTTTCSSPENDPGGC